MAKSAGPSTVNFMIPVTMKQGDMEALAREAMQRQPDIPNEASAIAGIATWVLGELSAGGLMVDAAAMQRITGLVGAIYSGVDLIPYIESAVSRRGAHLVGNYQIDPVYEMPLKELADRQGRTIQEVIQGIVDYAMAEGWIYAFEITPERLYFSAEDINTLKDLVPAAGHVLTGSDVAAYIKALNEVPSPKAQVEEKVHARL